MTKKVWLWLSNPDWYGFDENDVAHLLDTAPDIAKQDYEKWKEWKKDYEGLCM